MDIQIRYTQMEDGDYLKKWLEDPFVNRSYISSNTDEFVAESRLWINHSYLKCSLTATVEGAPVGIALLQLAPFQKIKHCAECSIIVSPEHQRMGIGTKLMRALFILGKEKFKIEIVNLFYLQRSSKKFYKKLGFYEAGEQKKFIKDPITCKYSSRIWMQKEL